MKCFKTIVRHRASPLALYRGSTPDPLKSMYSIKSLRNMPGLSQYLELPGFQLSSNHCSHTDWFNYLPPGYYFILFCSLLIFFFKMNSTEKCFQEYHQSDKQFGSNLSGLICVQTVCKGNQPMTLSRVRVIIDSQLHLLSSIIVRVFSDSKYDKCSKILNTSCLVFFYLNFKQCRHTSECFRRSSLIRIFPVCYSGCKRAA